MISRYIDIDIIPKREIKFSSCQIQEEQHQNDTCYFHSASFLKFWLISRRYKAEIRDVTLENIRQNYDDLQWIGYHHIRESTQNCQNQ